ncbi:Amino acid adenylation [Nitrococcus mobilis Nb-231]|uniref:Amino acid adenylation n=1 Tax=Nitrococcus mobilis Nb-231 TaxID=314278 RepID=A4BRH2_9GAMM|nr:Amino acid adenylation [Nitrococcus mobilis Nb-231]
MSVIEVQKAFGKTPCAIGMIDFGTEIEVDRLRMAVEQLCRRHEILRTTYQEIPGLKFPIQVISPAPLYSFQIIDASEEDEGWNAFREIIDVASGPVLSLTLLRGVNGGTRVVVAVPLCNADETALEQFAVELRDICAGADQPASEILQYVDYSEWQNELLESDFGRQGEAFWRAALLDPVLLEQQLPLERRSKDVSQIDRIEASDPEAGRAAGRIAANLGASTRSVLFSLWAAFLSKLLQQNQILVGFAADERNPELAGTMGRFTHTLPVVCRIEPQLSLRENMQALQIKIDECLTWKDCFQSSVRRHSKSGGPSFRYPFGFKFKQGEQGAARSLLTRLNSDDGGLDKLSLEYSSEGAEQTFRIAYAVQAFSKETVAVWLEQFLVFIKNAGSDWDRALQQIGLLGAQERSRVLREFSAGDDRKCPDAVFLHRLFELQAGRSPDAIALVFEDVEISYAELNRRANRLAHFLRERGVSPEDVVGVCLGNPVEVIVALLGILKAGGAYLPLDPSYPPERSAFMVQDSGARCILTSETLAQRLTVEEHVEVIYLDTESSIKRCDSTTPAPTVDSFNLAYLIYTSGSTGQPKGVMVSHANAVASTVARLAFYQEKVAGFLLLSSFSFDSSVAGIFWTLAQGGKLCLLDDRQRKDPNRIAERVARHGVSHVLTLPSFYDQILDALGTTGLRCAIVAGETCSSDLPARHFEKLSDTRLVNEYGPTEGTVWCTAWNIHPHVYDDRIPIGKPTPSMQIYVLDSQLEPVATGLVGEIYVGGRGLARGYRHRPALTAERFVPHPYAREDGERLYRTGDLGRWRADGVLEYVGRIDHQVKIRGFRIELGEIEARLREQNIVREAVVTAREDASGDMRLVAYVVPVGSDLARASGQVQAAYRDELGGYLRTWLPEHMVPGWYVWLTRLPLMPNGKVDRNALPAPDIGQAQQEYVAPRSATEAKLAEIWQAVLRLDRVGVYDDFFALGGHSLLATQVVSRVQKELRVAVPLRRIFESTTLEQLAQSIEASEAAGLTDEKTDRLDALLTELEAR